MSTDAGAVTIAAPTDPETTTFRTVLTRTIEEAGDNYSLAADWICDWMAEHVLLVEIDRILADDPDPMTRAACAVIRNYKLTNKQADDWRITHSAISKWVNGNARPSPEKYLAVSKYLGLDTLGEFYEMLLRGTVPATAKRLRKEVVRLTAEVEELRVLYADRDDELARAERSARLAERAAERLEDRVGLVERQLRERFPDVAVELGLVSAASLT